jgi:SAM-dependent methyltransferase
MATWLKSRIPLRLQPLAKSLYYSLRAIRYQGNAVECPICVGHFRRFLPSGIVTVRPQAICPRCAASERHRQLWLYLQQHTNLFTALLDVLHFAPEYSLTKQLARRSNLRYVTADLYRPATVKADITNIPFADHAFDVILCSHVLEHIPDDRRAMRELYRVLKPGGWAILLVPIELDRATTFEDATVTDPQERLRIFGQDDHVRIYGRDYVSRLQDAGFTVHHDAFTHTLPASLVRRYGLLDEPIFFCTRAAL